MKANELREMQTAELTSKLADLKAELSLIHISQKSGRGVVFWLTNQKKNGTIRESSARGRLLIQAPGKLTIRDVYKRQMRPSVRRSM